MLFHERSEAGLSFIGRRPVVWFLYQSAPLHNFFAAHLHDSHDNHDNHDASSSFKLHRTACDSVRHLKYPARRADPGWAG